MILHCQCSALKCQSHTFFHLQVHDIVVVCYEDVLGEGVETGYRLKTETNKSFLKGKASAST